MLPRTLEARGAERQMDVPPKACSYMRCVDVNRPVFPHAAGPRDAQNGKYKSGEGSQSIKTGQDDCSLSI